MKYVSTWIDSMSTGIYYFEGTASANLWGDYLSAWTAWNHTRPAARVRKEASLTTKLDIDNGYKCNTGEPLETSK